VVTRICKAKHKPVMKYIITIAFIFLSHTIFAQSKQTMQLFKQFVTVCNAYKQLPLQLTVNYKKTTNLPVRGDDSSTMQGVFYLQKNNAYISFGNVEQILTDSLALVVMGNVNQMLLSAGATDIEAKINGMINTPVKDASVEEFAKKYTIQQTGTGGTTAVLEITGRQNLYGTDVPAERVMLSYNPVTNEPQNITTIKRRLIKRPAADSVQYSATTVTIPQKGDYLIKEDVTDFVYKTITHDAGKKMPVILADRIVKDAAGSFVPVKAYQNYRLIVN
jgi:hypothetical protein